MKTDKIKSCILELVLILFLFFVLFTSNAITRMILAIIMAIITIFINAFLKKRLSTSIYKKQATFVMFISGVVYLVFLYFLGLFFGFVKPKVTLSLFALFRFIIPLTALIVSSEVIRKVLLSQTAEIKIKSIKINVSLYLEYLIMVLIDLVIYTDVYNLTNLDDFLVALGFVLFGSLCSNLLFNYVSKRYGSGGNIIFRMITILYVYIIPITPDVYIFFQSFLRMLYPYLLYIVLEKLFSKNTFVVSYVERKSQLIGNTILFVVATLFIMLISCQFRYGVLVVGSGSMTGSLNKGDAIIFEKYTDQKIKEGQVIVFNYNNIKTIHRVVSIIEENGVIKYYTKGDANTKNDDGYVTSEDIYGLVELRVKYIGCPTLWLRELFS